MCLALDYDASCMASLQMTLLYMLQLFACPRTHAQRTAALPSCVAAAAAYAAALLWDEQLQVCSDV
jgi:hypothetical protein